MDPAAVHAGLSMRLELGHPPSFAHETALVSKAKGGDVKVYPGSTVTYCVTASPSAQDLEFGIQDLGFRL
jgi:hypothetical protein